ncbi:hypothetical protein [Sphingomonas bacterium]|uniref:hypothetical protein n=1 Tax=Sphingomonas bacterium TaxID=1895847 RepID=UPI001576659E|nr:hypothetical protein [Sphingomonas bacterium]
MESVLLRALGFMLFIGGVATTLALSTSAERLMTAPAPDFSTAIANAVSALGQSSHAQLALALTLAGAIFYGAGAIVSAVDRLKGVSLDS